MKYTFWSPLALRSRVALSVCLSGLGANSLPNGGWDTDTHQTGIPRSLTYIPDKLQSFNGN